MKIIIQSDSGRTLREFVTHDPELGEIVTITAKDPLKSGGDLSITSSKREVKGGNI